MLHLTFHLVFALVILRWLSYEFKKPFKPLKGIIYLYLGLLLSITGWVLSSLDLIGASVGNILLHAVGGGMATSLVYEYLLNNLELKLNIRIEFAGLFLFVSAYGVINEISEYFGELIHYTIFSLDSQDTWRDLVANTTGAIIAFTIIKISKRFYTK